MSISNCDFDMLVNQLVKVDQFKLVETTREVLHWNFSLWKLLVNDKVFYVNASQVGIIRDCLEHPQAFYTTLRSYKVYDQLKPAFGVYTYYLHDNVKKLLKSRQHDFDMLVRDVLSYNVMPTFKSVFFTELATLYPFKLGKELRHLAAPTHFAYSNEWTIKPRRGNSRDTVIFFYDANDYPIQVDYVLKADAYTTIVAVHPYPRAGSVRFIQCGRI